MKQVAVLLLILRSFKEGFACFEIGFAVSQRTLDAGASMLKTS
jgi:hypothetical protein